MAQFIRVVSADDLAPGKAKCVEVAGKTLALFNLDGTFYAVDTPARTVVGPCRKASWKETR